MSAILDERSARKLCLRLLKAESEKEIIKILDEFGLWDDTDAWQLFGGRENNFSIIGNQQSEPVAAMVEKLVNSVDAVLMRECYLEGFDPEGPDAPRTIAEALERFFDVKAGNLANVGDLVRSRLAGNIGFVATGRKRTPNYTVFDWGEGQTPQSMPGTLLSLAESNKLRIPFVQGKFNMGGTGVLQFCGSRNFQLIISRRHPDIADPNERLADHWGFTIVRREDPTGGRRNSVYTYLAPGRAIPCFRSRRIQIPEIGRGTQALPALEWGTIIKLYEYEMTGAKTIISFDLYNQIALRLPRVGLPIRFFERRGYRGHTLETTMSGLHVRLEEDKRDNLEEDFPTHEPFRVRGEAMRASVYAFRKGQASKYRKNEGVLFTVNGQTHAVLTDRFFSRTAVGMSYLADSLLVIVDFVDISARTHEDLFMNSRDRLRSGDMRAAIERQLEAMLKRHQGLRELRDRRRREEIQGRLANARPLRDVLDDILKKSPALSALFLEGTALSNPFRSRLVGEQEKYEGKKHPTYFTLKKGEESKDCHQNLRFRVQFETDVVNDYFGRDSYPGHFTLHVNGELTENYGLNLWNGIATLTVTLPDGVRIGDELRYDAWVEDDTLIEPFHITFYRRVVGPIDVKSGRSGRRLPPAGSGDGSRQVPSGLSMPQIVEIREEDWENQGFDRFSALRVKGGEEGAYDFFVNLDNVYLQAEIKARSKVDPSLLEAQFKFGLVLVGLALLKEPENSDSSRSDEEEYETKEERVFAVAQAIAPILLPMIDSLGELEIEEDEYEEVAESG